MLSMTFMAGSVLSGAWGESVVILGGLSGLVYMSGIDGTSFKLSELGGLDLVSWPLVTLSVWVIGLSLMGSGGVKELGKLTKEFTSTLGALLVLLIFSFFFFNFFFFFFSFEGCLIPLMGLIIGWGYQTERGKAGMYLLMYTLFGSLPLLWGLLELSSVSGTGNMLFSTKVNGIFFFFFFFAFLVKFPMYGLHLWLISAHVQAPVAGSMILAGIALKLGGYGVIRVLPLLGEGVAKGLICGVALAGGAFISFVCLKEVDMKLLVAYSSVVHMSVCIGGLMMMSEWGIKGSVSMMVAHGLCSSGLFYMVNMVYERSSSRSFFLNNGLLNIMPGMSLCWFMLLSSNMGAPPSLNLLSEIMLMVSLVGSGVLVIFLMMFIFFCSVGYSVYMYSVSQHGAIGEYGEGCKVGLVSEYLVVMLHWLPLNLLTISVLGII